MVNIYHRSYLHFIIFFPRKFAIRKVRKTDKTPPICRISGCRSVSLTVVNPSVLFLLQHLYETVINIRFVLWKQSPETILGSHICGPVKKISNIRALNFPLVNPNTSFQIYNGDLKELLFLHLSAQWRHCPGGSIIAGRPSPVYDLLHRNVRRRQCWHKPKETCHNLRGHYTNAREKNGMDCMDLHDDLPGNVSAYDHVCDYAHLWSDSCE